MFCGNGEVPAMQRRYRCARSIDKKETEVRREKYLGSGCQATRPSGWRFKVASTGSIDPS